ncbi:hypothetical protein FGO68_gene563 [Halteria grandinella]|uniref:Protein kinase domain-containing protein n=1 Tax=Halteria grandinella TaxID=5974 RepID=A0A8J8P672_HALGN|nr:hypothetical protein FGO68_gene563 [Halteria grandinella]
MQDRFEYDPEDKGCQLGKGSYGAVYKAFDKLTKTFVALKVIKRTLLSVEEYDMIASEIELSLVLSEDCHPGLTRLRDVYRSPDQVVLVMDLVEGVNLFSWLMANQNKRLYSEKVALRIFSTLAETLRHVHGRGVVHRDIKLDNVIISIDEGFRNVQTKIIDFGLSILLLQGETHTKTLGSIAYLSPEIVRQSPHSFATDIWSLGIVLYTLLTGRMPFINQCLEKTMHNIKHKDINFNQTCWRRVSIEGKDLVVKMLSKQASERPRAAELLQHACFKQ